MKVFLSILLVLAFTINSNAAVHEVEVGGNQSITPYYSPQNLTISVGDTIHWSFVQGTHNVTSTSGPESFSSGDLESPNDFSFTFTVAGVYDYECTLWDHADTQFGTITVEANNTTSVSEINTVEINVFPVPATNVVNLSFDDHLSIEKVSLLTMNGQTILHENKVTSIDVSEISNGIYFLVINTNEGILRKKITIKR